MNIRARKVIRFDITGKCTYTKYWHLLKELFDSKLDYTHPTGNCENGKVDTHFYALEDNAPGIRKVIDKWVKKTYPTKKG